MIFRILQSREDIGGFLENLFNNGRTKSSRAHVAGVNLLPQHIKGQWHNPKCNCGSLAVVLGKRKTEGKEHCNNNNNSCFLTAYHAPTIVLLTLHVLLHLIFIKTSLVQLPLFFEYLFSDNENGRKEFMCSSFQSW